MTSSVEATSSSTSNPPPSTSQTPSQPTPPETPMTLPTLPTPAARPPASKTQTRAQALGEYLPPSPNREARLNTLLTAEQTLRNATLLDFKSPRVLDATFDFLGLFDFIQPASDLDRLALNIRSSILDANSNLTPRAARFGAYLVSDHAHTILGDPQTLAHAIIRHAVIDHISNTIYPLTTLRGRRA